MQELILRDEVQPDQADEDEGRKKTTHSAPRLNLVLTDPGCHFCNFALYLARESGEK